MTQEACPCGRSLPPGATICPACHRHLVGLLRAVPALLREVDTTITRQTTAREGLGSANPIDFDQAASDARQELEKHLRTYAHRAYTEHPPIPERVRAVSLLLTTPRGQAALLATYRRLAAAGWAGQCHTDVTAAVQAAEHAIDRPPDRSFVGWCPGAVHAPCGAALYALQDHPEARCTRCGSTWPVEASRAALLDGAAEVLADATTLGRALKLSPSTIRGWRHHGRLDQAVREDGKPACDPHGRPLYRVSDVRALALGSSDLTPPPDTTHDVIG